MMTNIPNLNCLYPSYGHCFFLFILSGKNSLNPYPQSGQNKTEDTSKQWSKQKQDRSENLKEALVN